MSYGKEKDNIPEQIGSILQRIFEDLIRKYEKSAGGAILRDLAESPDLSDPPTLSGRDENGPEKDN
jgi:hypothetical protein